MNKNFVNYVDFGAAGDGVTDDFAAIYSAHEYANKNGLPVVIDDGKTYYIHDTVIDGAVRSVEIKPASAGVDLKLRKTSKQCVTDHSGNSKQEDYYNYCFDQFLHILLKYPFANSFWIISYIFVFFNSKPRPPLTSNVKYSKMKLQSTYRRQL